MSHRVLSPQQFYHGTSAQLSPGAMIESGHEPNFPVDKATYPNPGKEVFFTGSRHLAQGYADRVGSRRGVLGRTYRVEPTGSYETHAGSYRSASPLRVMEEI